MIDHAAYQWRATDWRGRPWHEAVLLEAHVGTFTREGTYRAMIDKLDHLVETGITALELMPLADFAGTRNWGYDGVLWYAPDSAYGRPDDLKALIDAAHQRGLMVFLDVVYNHFGPEGNYLGRYAPHFFTDAQTPWGSAIDYRVPRSAPSRSRMRCTGCANIASTGCGSMPCTQSPNPAKSRCCVDLSEAAGKLAAETGRHIHLVLENDDNRASLLDPGEEPPRGKYRAQWNDDYHHAWHVLLTGEDAGLLPRLPALAARRYRPRARLGLCLSGRTVRASRRAARGEPSGDLSPIAFINFLQNHDQIGNRALGDRLESDRQARGDRSRAADHAAGADDADAVHGRGMGLEGAVPVLLRFQGRTGRRRPQGPAQGICLGLCKIWRRDSRSAGASTIQSAVLDWERARRASRHASGWRWCGSCSRSAGAKSSRGLRAQVLATRKAADDGLLTAHWRMGDGATLSLTANLSDRDIAASVRASSREP